MNKLWIAFMVIATYGSMYPFDFRLEGVDVAALAAFLQSCCQELSAGDVLGNVILFVPFGFFGMFAGAGQSSAAQRLLVVCVIGTAFALALQVAQLSLPSRAENLQDVLWNVFGTLGGALGAAYVRRYVLPSSYASTGIDIVPGMLIGTWVCYRLLPFVPSLDFQEIKDSLKPLLLYPRVEPVNVLHDTVAWVVIAYLLRQARRDRALDMYLPGLIGVVFCLEVVIVSNTVSVATVAGGILAICFWWGIGRHLCHPEAALVMLLGVMLVASGLAPFSMRPSVVPFGWLPFQGFLGGSMSINAQTAAEKVFFYGSLVYLVWRMGFSRMSGTTIAGVGVLGLEIAQTYVGAHTPEITDPLLLIAVALMLLALERFELSSVMGGRAAVPSTRSSIVALRPSRATAGNARRGWMTQTVNLHADQSAFLSHVAQDMGITVSRLIRRMIAQYMRQVAEDTPAMVGDPAGAASASIPLIKALRSRRQSGRDQQDWDRVEIYLRRKQFDFLAGVSEELGISVSRVTRRIIVHFIHAASEEDVRTD